MQLNYKPAFTTTLCFVLLLAACKKQDIEAPKEPEKPAPPPANTITMKQKAVSTPVGNAVRGYYIASPSDYDRTTKKYPLLLYIPGAGQFGNGTIDLPLLLNDGAAQLIDEGKFPTNIAVGNDTLSFIVMTPQFTWYPATYSVDACVEHAKSLYRIDTTRIYLSGLSMGGILSCDLGSEQPSKFAAIVAMAGVSRDYDVGLKARLIGQANLPVWAFHCNDDYLFDVQRVRTFINDINGTNPSRKSKGTYWPSGGHDAWTRALEPNYREDGKNIYEWMLQYKR
jgi:predicted peptidase